MADPYIGEIRIIANNYAPYGWAYCNGQAVAVAQYQALYAVIGTTFGGDGINTFNLPNMIDLVPMCWGQGTGLTPHSYAEKSGSSTVTLSTNQLPQHNHTASAINTPATATTGNSSLYFARMVETDGRPQGYGPDATKVAMYGGIIGSAGTNTAHDNMQPYLSIPYAIALEGIFPVRP